MVHARQRNHRVLWPLLRLGPKHPEFQAQNLAYRVGCTAKQFSPPYPLSWGVSLFWHHAWGRKLALCLLVVETIYGSTSFAWGFSGGPPTVFRGSSLFSHSRSRVEWDVVLRDLSGQLW